MGRRMEGLIERAANDLLHSTFAVALTGAGVSTESGIPDFRGPEGIWTKHPEAEIEAYEHYSELLKDPKTHWERILEPDSIFMLFEKFSEYLPNSGHYALAEMESLGMLHLIITQNADSLHDKAGSRNVIEYHGSMLKLRCMSCHTRFPRSRFDLAKMKSAGDLPPKCDQCNGVLKYDGVYFTEPIPKDVALRSVGAVSKCDVMLICGTSATVYPFADLPKVAKARKVGGFPSVTIIEVNAEPTPLTYAEISDYFIEGKTGEALPQILDKAKAIKGK